MEIAIPLPKVASKEDVTTTIALEIDNMNQVDSVLIGKMVSCGEKKGMFHIGDKIHCQCCGETFALTAFSLHGGNKSKRPWQYIKLVENGNPILTVRHRYLKEQKSSSLVEIQNDQSEQLMADRVTRKSKRNQMMNMDLNSMDTEEDGDSDDDVDDDALFAVKPLDNNSKTHRSMAHNYESRNDYLHFIRKEFVHREKIEDYYFYFKDENEEQFFTPWTMQEKNHLIYLLNYYGLSSWGMFSRLIPGRTGIQCLLIFQELLASKAISIIESRKHKKCKGKNKDSNSYRFLTLLPRSILSHCPLL